MIEEFKKWREEKAPFVRDEEFISDLVNKQNFVNSLFVEIYNLTKRIEKLENDDD
jgi:hypothetical protein